jgi:hypothetical protein
MLGGGRKAENTRHWKEKFQKVAFSRFLLGNREKIAVVANADFSLFPAKMPG